MTIIIEPTERFGEIPETWQETARKYMLGREFNSLEEVFNQQDERGIYILSNFHIGEKRIRPNNLPYTITEVNIIAACRAGYNDVVLKAKVK